MGDVMNAYGHYIKEKRIEKGLSQAEVAKRLNISQVAYGRYELGIREVGVELIFDIADALGIDADEFFREMKERKWL